ncbi:MAG: sigma 54-interacting transcriptional regulator [Syntrophorhabdaceae bacterium]|nr:sigma 54-interacting transcriptional regulator [Syntrophorhabdaceae bacterium]
MDPKTSPFKELLLEISKNLIYAPMSALEGVINRGLEHTGNFFNVNRIFLFGFSPKDGKRNLLFTFSWSDQEGVKKENLHEKLPWLFEKILQGETLSVLNLPHGVPDHALIDIEFFKEEGIKSFIALPFKVKDDVCGGIVCCSCNELCNLTEEMVEGLPFLGEIIVGAVLQRGPDKKIEEVLKFEKLLSEISATYINLPTHEIENFVKRDLGRFGRLVGVDRCVLYLVGKDNKFSRFDWPYFWFREEDEEDIRKLNIWTAGLPNLFDNLQYCFEKWYKGEHINLSTLDELPPEGEKVKELYRKFGVKSALSVPISVGGSTIGALVLTTTRSHRTWPEELVPRARLFGEVFANALMRKRADESLRNALIEIKQLKERFESDYMYLREEFNEEHDFSDIIGKSEPLKAILLKVKQVAPTNATVLILGETGTGKGLIARAIHNLSKRKHRPFVQVNCASLSPSLIESELFGHEKGAFTGATGRRIGRFEIANGTTLFLDEIGELSIDIQAKLLRVLQDGEFERVGGSETIKTDVRIIAATNKDLQKMVEEGRFRSDLWYRLSVFPIYVPPLRERTEDIQLFVHYFVNKYGKWMGKKFDVVPQKTIKALKRYSWPGNIRELENLIERAVITSPGNNLQIELPKIADEGGEGDENLTLAECERRHILKILKDTNWKIEGPGGAAAILGLKPSTLRFKAKKLNIKRPQ